METATLAAPPDYADTIRSEIARDVLKLIERVANWSPPGGWERVDDDEDGFTYIELGYMVNLHRGRDLYCEGDLIEGLPVRLHTRHGDPYPTRSIAVCANDVLYERDVMVSHMDKDNITYDTEQERFDIHQTITW